VIIFWPNPGNWKRNRAGE